MTQIESEQMTPAAQLQRLSSKILRTALLETAAEMAKAKPEYSSHLKTFTGRAPELDKKAAQWLAKKWNRTDFDLLLEEVSSGAHDGFLLEEQDDLVWYRLVGTLDSEEDIEEELFEEQEKHASWDEYDDAFATYQPPSLDDLANRIKQECEAVDGALGKAVQHAINAGKLLIEARRRLKIQHGEWGPWLEANCPLSERTAQEYMRLAREAANPQRAADLERGSIRQALQLMSKNQFSMDADFSNKSAEWYTPQNVLDLAVKALGEIDLDPSSNLDKTVPAKMHYTKEDNGLSKPWSGRVFLNPPYGEAEWISKAIEEYEHGSVTEAILLLPDRTGTKWFGSLRDYYRCHVTGHLNFISGDDPEGSKRGRSPSGSVIFYLGKNQRRFFDAFSDIGDVYRRVRTVEELEGTMVQAATEKTRRRKSPRPAPPAAAPSPKSRQPRLKRKAG
jgi:phage N-6-adenine-methyltransferase